MDQGSRLQPRFQTARTRLAVATVLVGITVQFAASAQTVRDVDLRTFRPSADRRGSLATEGIETQGHLQWQASVWTHVATRSARLRPTEGWTEGWTEGGAEAEAGGRTLLVGTQLIVEPTVALGLWRRGQLGLGMPLVLAQDSQVASAQGLGDLAVSGKLAVLLPDPDIGGWGVALLGRATLPTGDRHSYVSDRGLQGEAQLLAGYDFGHVLAATWRVGVHLRGVEHELELARPSAFDDAGAAPSVGTGGATVNPGRGVVLGHALPWGATLAFRPRILGLDAGGHWTWMVEGHGELGVSSPWKARASHVLVGPSARYAFSPSWSAFGGAEFGLTGGLGEPRVRAVLGITWAPTVVDDDHDGVADERDDCPGIAEDGKGASPHDGCPSFD